MVLPSLYGLEPKFNRENENSHVYFFENAPKKALDQYVDRFLSLGFAICEERSVNGHSFVALFNGRDGVFVNYFEEICELYIVIETETAYFSHVPTNGAGVTPQITQIKTVLHNAHIEVPDIVPAVPDSAERTELLRDDLQRGTGFEDGKQRVADYVQKNRPTDTDLAEYLKKEYGCGGHSGPKMPDVSYDSKGIHIRTADKARAYNYTWIEVAKELSGMIERGEYLTEKQETALAEAAPAEPSDPWTKAKALHQRIVNDAQTAAESIWDMSQAIKEMRDGKHYKLDDYEVMTKYGPKMVMWGRIPEALSGAMANQMYVANFDTEEEMMAFYEDLAAQY